LRYTSIAFKVRSDVSERRPSAPQIRHGGFSNLIGLDRPQEHGFLSGHKTRSVFEPDNIVNEADRRDAVRMLAGTKKGHSAETPAADAKSQSA
jgi:hypothetical protein